MTDYTMPVLSEQEREELIKHNIAKINAITPQFMREKLPGVKRHLMCELNSAKTALASLTAKPEYFYRIRSDGGREGPLHESETEDVRKKSWEALYPAPHVPVKQEGEQ